VHNDRIYTLSSDLTVRVHDLEGRSITSWTHTDETGSTSQLTILNNHIAIPKSSSRTVVFYSLNGILVNTIPCSLITGIRVRMSAADNTSIIISQHDSSLVTKLNTSSGHIVWQCKEVAKPYGVTSYSDKFVIVVNVTKPTTLCVLSLHTG